MTIATREPDSILLRPKPTSVTPSKRLVSVAEFHELWAAGTYSDRRVALVEGEVHEMPIPGPQHNRVLTLSYYRLMAVFQVGYFLRIQMPLVLGLKTDPVPDIAVIAGDPRALVGQPTSAALVVEVSDTSVLFDLKEKASAYAAGGIADYWVADINGHRLIVHRDPVADPASPTGSRYGTVLNLGLADAVAPLAVPTASVAVADLLS